METMTSFKVTLAYDGTDFVGWQRQASGTSIQGLLEGALCTLDERAVTVTGAGRTDAGVHALGQVASFSLDRDIEPGVLLRAVNARLPSSVRVVAFEVAAATFHARFGATRTTYRYRIWNGDPMNPFERAYAWHLPGPLDVDAMKAAAILVEGRRDFAAFQAAGSSTTSTEREVFSSVVARAHRVPGDAFQTAVLDSSPSCHPLVEYEVTGSGFLRHMVRNIVGSLVEVGRGRRPPEWISALLDGRDRARSGPTAPAQGLVLVAVEYGREG
jgi:tRNA pseudouridine38-40 synthase